jgi:hypothetical protein
MSTSNPAPQMVFRSFTSRCANCLDESHLEAQTEVLGDPLAGDEQVPGKNLQQTPMLMSACIFGSRPLSSAPLMKMSRALPR